ncbi:MAG: hypothetical protein IIC73_01165, partial [Armatimonadetes bacterium]|nr:hypothetical protein [Armatimonadota bacterium]
IGHRTIAFALGAALLLIPGLLAAVGSALPLYATIVSQSPRVVEEVVYNRSLGVFLVAILALIGIAPFLGWTRTNRERISRLTLSLALSLALTVAAIFVLRSAGLTRPEGNPMDASELILYEAIIAVGVFAIVSNCLRCFERFRTRSGNMGSFFAHIGIAMLLLGIIVSRAFGKEGMALVAVGEPATIIGAEVNVLAEPSRQELLNLENRVPFSVKWGKKNHTLSPVMFEARTAMGDLQSVTRPAIHSTPFYDLYLSTGSMVTDYADEIRIRLGETVAVGEFEFTFEDLQVVGTAQAGTVNVVATMAVQNAEGETRQFDVSRTLENGRFTPESAGVEFAEFVRMRLDDVDFEEGAITVSIPYERPVFPVQLLFRPMTVLVWLGVAFASVGTLLAFRRR